VTWISDNLNPSAEGTTTMYFTDDSLLPENQFPLMITAAPYGPMWMPGDCTPEQRLPVSWDEQTQAAVDCFNAGATILHIHVRDPKTGHISKNFKEYADQVGRLRQAVPKMILQVGGSISFAPEPGEEAKFQSYDSRHKLAEIDPKPDQVTVACGTSLYDLTALHPAEAFAGTRFENPKMMHAMANLVADSTPDFFLENIKQLVQHGIQPYFALPHVHGLEIVERLIRKGYYMGPINGFFSIGGGGMCGANPFDLMELIRRTPHGSCFTYQTTFRLTHPVSAICIALGQHTRAGIEDNLWDTTKGVRMNSIQMIERHVRMAKELGRAIATPEQAHQMLKIGVSYNSTAETLANVGLPPNRHPGNMGFLVHETDGRFYPAAQGGCGHIHAGEWEERVKEMIAPAAD
jgi:uncharacterized protein (DUF849 family)